MLRKHIIPNDQRLTKYRFVERLVCIENEEPEWNLINTLSYFSKSLK